MPNLFFLPGAGGSADFWRPVGDRLPAGWAKTYFSWPGLGEEPAEAGVESVEDLAGIVERRLGEEPVDLVAQSMGGVVALLTALRNPGRVRRLVLAVTSGGVDAAVRAGAMHDWRAAYRAQFPSAGDWITTDRTDLTGRLREVASPTLLLFGEADPIAPPFVGERLAGLLPDARLHIISGGGHDLVMSRVEEVVPLIRGHLHDCNGSGA